MACATLPGYWTGSAARPGRKTTPVTRTSPEVAVTWSRRMTLVAVTSCTISATLASTINGVVLVE